MKPTTPTLRVVATPAKEASTDKIVKLVAKGLGMIDDDAAVDDLLGNALAATETELRCLSELTFHRDSHLSAALERLADRLAAIGELAAATKKNGAAVK